MMARLGRHDDRTRYVVGFAFNFSDRYSKVALIEKTHGPHNAKMKGTFNGIGGAVKPRESYQRAMIREFHQEAGLIVPHWDLFAIVEGDAWRLFCFCKHLSAHDWRRIKTLGKSPTDEMVVRFSTRAALIEHTQFRGGDELLPALYPDVPALISIALSKTLWESRAVHIDRRGL